MFESAWRAGYARVLAALHQKAQDIPDEPSTNDAASSPALQYFKRSPPESVLRSLFTYESFLSWLGRVGINREDDGGTLFSEENDCLYCSFDMARLLAFFTGLYFLHSALNHACNPNAALRRRPPPSASASSASASTAAEMARPSQIYLIALRPLARGEEITLTYINPQWSLESRRAAVRRDYMFECKCARCVDELAQEGANGADARDRA
jgi:hypothetical protein